MNQLNTPYQEAKRIATAYERLIASAMQEIADILNGSHPDPTHEQEYNLAVADVEAIRRRYGGIT